MGPRVPEPTPDIEPDVPSQPYLDDQLHGRTTKKGRARGPAGERPTGREAIEAAAGHIKKDAPAPFRKLPEEVQQSVKALEPGRERAMHGSKFSLAFFPGPMWRRPCGDRFGYLSKDKTRKDSALPFTAANKTLLANLGEAMAATAPDRPASANSTIVAGMTYVGQFVDHDITLDISSSLDVKTDAETIHNMRSPSLDLDSVYGQGPVLDPFLYDTPAPGAANPTAIKLRLGTNTDTGPGGPSSTGDAAGMVTHTDRDVPRMPSPAHTAIIGDPRNDENLIVVQLHHAMLRFHNAVVDSVVTSGFTGDVFVEAKRITTHHYQWAVVHDFLKTVCGQTAVDNAMASVTAPVNSAFRMPVEFSVAAYRFGHSMIRDRYFVNFNFPTATLGQVFEFNRDPLLPVFSNWVVDFNAYFDTGVATGRLNRARKIDTGIAQGLSSLPGFSGMMAELAVRNLLRGLALGLPSGQAMAKEFGVTPLTTAQLTDGLPTAESDALTASGQKLAKQTPLWYYCLREAAVLHDGNQLGPVGGRIVAGTFARILKRDPDSFVNLTGGFTPFLPSTTPDDFTFADLVTFAGANQV